MINLDNMHNYDDVDWLFKADNLFVHAASAGGKVPESFMDNQEAIYCEVVKLKVLCECEINYELLGTKLGLKRGTLELERYLLTFREWAKRGFYSFDRYNISDPDDNNYILVAWPTNQVTIDMPSLPSAVAFSGNIFTDPVDLIAAFDQHS